MARPAILVVDDDLIILQAIEGLLEGEGYNLHFESCSRKVIRVAHDLLPDVILLDVMMPDLNGFEVCEQIRQDPILAEVPILMVTAMDDREAMLRGLSAGADDFLAKPIDRLEFRLRLRTITRLDRYRKLYQERTKIEQARDELREAYEKTIEGWASALDLRDRETEGHSQRVKNMTVSLSRAIGISGDALTYIAWGALLHDMGKLAVPDKILHKIGQLSEAEWKIMRKHPEYSYEMLSPIKYLRPAIDIPYCHHEKWDGSGYPRGLKGEEIPLAARIFALVDVWDALTSNRPYRSAWLKEDVKGYIMQESGKHFDPNLVGLFLSFCSQDNNTFGQEKETSHE